MSWTKVAPYTGTKYIGCLNCSTAGHDVAPLDMWIAVGFGEAHVEKDGKTVWSETRDAFDDESKLWTVADAEREAAKDPDHDWRIEKYGPLHGEVYQRHGPEQWVLIESNMGFA